MCPASTGCRFAKLFHFHCARQRCHFATNYAAAMDQHSTTGFHASCRIANDFEYFDRTSADCGKAGCVAPQRADGDVDGHFHCRLCEEAVMTADEQISHRCVPKNGDDIKAANNNNVQDEEELKVDEDMVQQKSDVKMDEDKWQRSHREPNQSPCPPVVRAAGTYFPQNSGSRTTSPANISATSPAQSSTSTDFASPPVDSTSCLRPFCKLKKKTHSHCDLCNQAFTDEARLKAHYLKHQSTRLAQQIGADQDKEVAPQDLSASSSSSVEKLSPNAIDKMIAHPSFVDNFSLQNLHLAHLAFYQQNPFYYQNLYPFLSSQGVAVNPADMLQAQLDQQQTQQHPHGLDLTASSNFTVTNEMLLAMAGKRPPSEQESATATKMISKRMKQTPAAATSAQPTGSSFKMFKDEPIPQGYLKFRFNEDCQFTNCGYRNHQSHFHCCRTDCYYSFCDKTRFVQHTARHERLDKLMGDDFRQFRANMQCGYAECAYNRNMGE